MRELVAQQLGTQPKVLPEEGGHAIADLGAGDASVLMNQFENVPPPKGSPCGTNCNHGGREHCCARCSGAVGIPKAGHSRTEATVKHWPDL